MEDAVAVRPSAEKISWSDSLLNAFNHAKQILGSSKTIHLPQPKDQLWVVTDGAVKAHELGATLHITHDKSKPQLAGYFSAKLRKRQIDWQPCELEALCIAASVSHFSPYIIQSAEQTCVLTNSQPSMQAYHKLSHGEFSASSRITTFLTAVSRYHVSVRHLSGAANTPSDFTCCNAKPCTAVNCQICNYIAHMEDSVVRGVSVQDVLSGITKLPYSNRSAWHETQSECSDLRRTHAHLSQGTRPSKKATNIKDIKRYLQVATITSDGLIVVHKTDPFSPVRECVIVPRSVFPGLVTALHIKLNHPSPHQLKQVIRRYFFALDLDHYIDEVYSACHHCASLHSFPKPLVKQSTSDLPPSVETTFAADIIHHARQFILVLRECMTSYTQAMLIDGEDHAALRNALLQLCLALRPLEGPPASVRVDSTPGFQALLDDKTLHKYQISLEIGRKKNINKNPVAEHAVQEVEYELLQQDPTGGSVSPVTLSIALSHLNSHLRSRGLSAREMWSQRDQYTNSQISVSDSHLSESQHLCCQENHKSSELSKAPHGLPRPCYNIKPGDLVYLYVDHNKLRGRDRYMVVSVDNDWCNLRQFVGSQFRAPSYRVKMQECYKVLSDFSFITSLHTRRQPHSEYSSNDD